MKQWMYFVLACFLIAACGGGSGGEATYTPEADMAMKNGRSLASYQQGAEQLSGPEDGVAVEKKLIRRARMQIEIDDFAEARNSLQDLLDKYDATIRSESVQELSSRKEGNFDIRILPERLDSLLDELEVMAQRTEYRSVEVEDVTRQYIDLSTRLETKRSALQRYRDLMRSANDVEDVLAVEEQMQKLIEEIESTERQLRYLSDQVDYSHLQLEMYQIYTQASVNQRSFWKRLALAMSQGWQVLLDLIVGLLSVWPLTILGFLLIWWLYRRFLK